MMLFLYFLTFNAFALPISELKKGDGSKFKKIKNRTHGTMVVRIQVHSESAAIIALRAAMVTEFSTDLNALSTVRKFFGGIFDIINEDIQNLGVQIRGDFSELLLDSMPWDKTKCMEPDPLLTRTNIAKGVFMSKTPKLGNRIALLFCPEKMFLPPKTFNFPVQCGNITGVMFGELRQLKEAVTDAVYKMISYGTGKPINQTANFERELAKYSSECIGSEKNIFGEFVRDLKAVRHLATERYILKDGEKIKEHDLMDDIYLLKAGVKRIVGHPTEDYSNDDELYTDINE